MEKIADKDDEIMDICLESLDTDYGNKTEPTFDIEAGGSLFNGFFLGALGACSSAFAFQLYFGLARLEAVDPENFTFRFANWGGQGNPSGILTGMFLHGSFGHILGNLVFLCPLAMVVHKMFGTAKSWALYVGFGIISGIGTYLTKTTPSIGASGAIFGMFGLVTVIYVRRRAEFSENLRDAAWVLPIVAAYQLASGYLNPVIDNMAHVTGFVAGIIVGLAVTEKRKGGTVWDSGR